MTTINPFGIPPASPAPPPAYDYRWSMKRGGQCVFTVPRTADPDEMPDLRKFLGFVMDTVERCVTEDAAARTKAEEVEQGKADGA